MLKKFIYGLIPIGFFFLIAFVISSLFFGGSFISGVMVTLMIVMVGILAICIGSIIDSILEENND